MKVHTTVHTTYAEYRCYCGRRFNTDRVAAEQHWQRSMSRGRLVAPGAWLVRLLLRGAGRLERALMAWAHGGFVR